MLFLFLLFFVQETKLRSNRTPHPPPALAVVFLVFSPPLCFVSPVLAVRPFCSGVSSGCHSGPRAVFGFSRDCSEALFLGREAVEAFVRFLVCCFSRFAASHVSRGPCTYLQVGGPAGGLARSPCLSEGKGSNALLGRRGSDPLLFGSFLLLVFALGHRDPRAFLFAGAIRLFRP